MKGRHLLCAVSFVSAGFLTGSAIAADASVTTTQIQNEPSTAAPSPNRPIPDSRWVGGSERVDNTNSVPNAVPPQSSMDYDVPPNYPTQDRAVPPRTGSDAIPGYMGPGSARGE